MKFPVNTKSTNLTSHMQKHTILNAHFTMKTVGSLNEKLS